MLKMLGAAGNRHVEKIRIFQRAERRALRCVNAIAGAPGFLATIARAPWRELDTSVGVPEPHVLAVRRKTPSSEAPASVHRIPSRVCDDRETPLWWDGTGSI